MTLSATALTSITNVETLIGLTAGAQDAVLTLLIDKTSRRITDYLNREIVSQSFTNELYEWPWTRNLVLKQPDVSAVGFLACEKDSAFTASYSGSDTHARIEVTDTQVTLVSRAGATSTSNALTYASNATVGAIVTAINAVSGWTATTVTDGPSAYLARSGSKSAKSNTVTVEAWTEYTGEYATNYKTGIITFGAGRWYDFSGYPDYTPNMVRVDYTAGFSTIPEGVELTCMEMVRDAWFNRARDTTLQSESLGDYSYTNAIPQVASNPTWVDRLSTYVRVTQ